MRVVLDGRCIQDHFPGIARYTFNLANHLGRYLTANDELIVLVDSSAVNNWYDLRQPQNWPGLTLCPIAARVISIPGLVRVAGALRALRPDVYHSPYYLFPPVAVGRVVVSVFDLIPERSAWRWTPVERARRLVYRLAFATGLRRAHRIIVPSDACGAELARIHGTSERQVVRIPLGVDPTFRPVDRPSIVHLRERFDLPARFILTVGVNKPHKNHAGLVRALAFLPRNVSLVVAGPRDRRFPDARDVAARVGMADRVISLGPVASADLPALYAAADAFVFPSFDEGFGLPPLEAMACGTPVACARTGSLPEVVGEAATLFDPNDPADMATTIRAILNDEPMRRHLRCAGLEHAAKYRWDHVAAATWRVYRDAWSAP